MPDIVACNILDIRYGWYLILVSSNWDNTCIWTDIPPKDINMVDITTLYIFEILSIEMALSPIVISNIPLIIAAGYEDICNLFIINVQYKKQ